MSLARLIFLNKSIKCPLLTYQINFFYQTSNPFLISVLLKLDIKLFPSKKILQFRKSELGDISFIYFNCSLSYKIKINTFTLQVTEGLIILCLKYLNLFG